MPEWSYIVPPDVGVTVRAGSEPRLLPRLLGDEAPAHAEPALVLDFASEARGDAVARGSYKGVGWSCGITRGDCGWTLVFRSPVVREYLALHIALLPALRELLLDRDVALAPGGAFEIDGAATMTAGMTGSGKTSLLMGAVDRGARFLGDEYVGLAATGEAYPVVHALALRRASLRLSGRTSGLSTPRRLALRAAELATAVTLGRLEPLVHVSPSELGVEAAAVGLLQRFFWLEAARGSEVRREPMAHSAAADQLARIWSVHEEAYEGIAPALAAAAAWDADDRESRWRRTLEQGLEKAACFRLSFPRRAIAEALDEVVTA